LLAPLPRTKSKQKLERRSRRTKKKENQNQKKQKQEEEEEEEYLLRRSKGGFTTSSTSFLTNIVDHNAYRRNRIPEEQLSVEEAASNRSRSQFL
jgi:signal recognition particle GTPase